ncbi:MAG: hypothetical protein LBT40_01075, partial [Deltaproteobacteria bacterium]|nr:hypothetical protein [Deltaproteobacteria bacterium]
LDSLEEVSPATPTVNRSEEEPGVMGGIEMFVRWWYLNGYRMRIMARRQQDWWFAQPIHPLIAKIQHL